MQNTSKNKSLNSKCFLKVGDLVKITNEQIRKCSRDKKYHEDQIYWLPEAGIILDIDEKSRATVYWSEVGYPEIKAYSRKVKDYTKVDIDDLSRYEDYLKGLEQRKEVDNLSTLLL